MNNFPFKYFVMVFFLHSLFSYNIWQLNTAMNNTGTGIVSIECQFGSIRGGRINLYRYSIRHIDSGLGGLGFHIRCYCWCFWEIDSVSFTWRIWRRILVPLECVFGALAHTQIRDWMEFMIEEGSIIRHMNLWLSMYVEFSRIFFFHSYFAACARFSSLLCEWNIVWFDVADHIPFDAVFIDNFFSLVWFIRPWMSVFGATEMRSTIRIDGMRKALHEMMIFLENIALSNIFGDWWRWDGFLWDDRKLWCSD